MKKTIFILAGFAGLAITGCKKNNQTAAEPVDDPVVCPDANKPQSGDIIAGRYIVSFDPEVVGTRSSTPVSILEKSENLLEEHDIASTSVKAVFGGDRGGFVATLSPEQANELKQDFKIKTVEPDRVIALATCFSVVEPRLITWNIQRVGYGNGEGKTAWIIDTGIDFDHPDLKVDITRSKSFIANGPTADDENGHGTHVAGIIGGLNNTIGVLGVASGANLVSLRVLDHEGSGTLSAVIQALAHVNTNGKAGDVVNLSLGEEVSSPSLIANIQATAAKGIYFAIAAGNDNQAANKVSPANANGTNIYTVSAVDSLDRFASFSNFGNDVVDYAAPGVRILSTYFNGRYAYMSGTSMAAPHMAGLLLLRGSNITTSGYAVNDPDGVADPIAHK